jgi:outer membrane protein OmpA-like peptidoglycan-associated protein
MPDDVILFQYIMSFITLPYNMRFSKKVIPFLLFAFAGLICFAHGKEKFDVKANKKAAEERMKEGSTFAAIDLYLRILEHDSTEKSVFFPLAQAYFLERDYESGATYFNKAYKADPAANILALYYAGICTKMQGRYKDAIPLFKQFSKNYSAPDAVKMKRWSHIEVDGCNFAMNEAKPDPSVELIHLGKEVNSNYIEQSPALRDDELYFASLHSDTVITMKPDMSDRHKESMLMKLYSSKVTGDEYAPAEQIKTFSEPGKHISNSSFNDDGTKFLYTICDGNLLAPPCKIYMSKLDGTEWSKGEELNETINLKGSTNTNPYLAKTSNGTEILYFVSDREGGRGGLDIWYSVVSKKGDFGIPRNAGPKVNSDRDERTPFLDGKTNTLYFSSNGWIGMGGLDIFKAQADATGKVTGHPENLGAPFNSPCNDYFFRFGKSSEDGYLVSNRPGIFTVRGKTCCDDIFEYKYIHRIYLAVTGRVFDDSTKTPIDEAAVNLSLRSDNPDENDVTINTDTSSAGTPYFFNLKAEKLYKVTGLKDGYFTASQTFATLDAKKSDTMTVDIYLKKMEKNKAYRLNNIYYDFDKADLRPQSKATLDSLYNILIENPTIIIELSSHTDQRGSADYNLDLSQRRAQSCVDYLVNIKGIPKDRITAKGYGKSKPLEDCTKVPGCPMDQSGDCPCHQLNRRTEFKIIGELKGDVIYDKE